MEHKKIQSTEEYLNSMHRMGRIGALIAIALMLLMPTVAGIYFQAMPSILQVISTSVGLLAIFVPIAISEVIAYTPILGSSIYLTLITGNVTNLKLPVANNAMNLLDIEYGSEDADVVSSIAVSVSSFTTILIIALGVVLMIPLQPILTIPAVQVSTSYILPALFGSLALGTMTSSIGGGVKAPGRLKGAIAPAILVAALTLLDKYLLHIGIMSTFQGFVIIAMLPVAYFGTRALYRKGKIQVILPGEEDQTAKQTD